MSDEQLAEIVLTALRDVASPTQTLDIQEIARSHGVTVHYEAQRVAQRMVEQGWIEDAGFSGQSLLARITDRGRAALASGEYRQLTDRAVNELNAGGRTAEARGEA